MTEEGSMVRIARIQSVWTSASGEYILTDSPGYNPNVESNQNRQEIRKE